MFSFFHEISQQEKYNERYQNVKHNDPFEAHLLHENLLKLKTLNELKNRLTIHDLNLECKKERK